MSKTDCIPYVAGISSHNLTSKGIEQARNSAESLIKQIGGLEELRNVIVLSSPFLRAMSTARICLNSIETILQDQKANIKYQDIDLSIQSNDGLRERYFGEFDQRDLLFYNRVWPVDMVRIIHKTAHISVRLDCLILS